MQTHVVPDERDRAAELDAGADDQVTEVAPAEAVRLVPVARYSQIA
ncbi:hypothetical protein [Streptomyces sp. NPDC046332]